MGEGVLVEVGLGVGVSVGAVVGIAVGRGVGVEVGVSVLATWTTRAESGVPVGSAGRVGVNSAAWPRLHAARTAKAVSRTNPRMKR